MPNESHLVNSEPFCASKAIVIGNGTKILSSSIGSGELIFDNCSLFHTNLLHTSNATANLLSIQKNCANNKVLLNSNLTLFMLKILILKKLFFRVKVTTTCTRPIPMSLVPNPLHYLLMTSILLVWYILYPMKSLISNINDIANLVIHILTIPFI